MCISTKSEKINKKIPAGTANTDREKRNPPTKGVYSIIVPQRPLSAQKEADFLWNTVSVIEKRTDLYA